ncbi:MAG: HAMP domain-containing protein [Acidobacteriota bacterium]|nr:HAMP domain-containing protein [Acidobacteriota bacterium]
MSRLTKNIFLAVLLIASATLVLWQVSFTFPVRPEDPAQTLFFFAVSLLIFVLMVTLGFMLVRIVIKMWIDRRSSRPGSRIRTKLIGGALVLSILPVFCMVAFNWLVLNRTLARWFFAPTEHVMNDIRNVSGALFEAAHGKALAEAQLIASMPEAAAQIENSSRDSGWLEAFCKSHKIASAAILPNQSMRAAARCGKFPPRAQAGPVTALAPVQRDGVTIGGVFVDETIPLDFARQMQDVEKDVRDFNQTYARQRQVKVDLTLMSVLIALFVLFVAGWLAQFMARQISGPISSLLRAAEEVSRGNLAYRLDTKAIDELAQLVEGFNRMTSELEANRAELDSRRRFTEAILESIPTGIISLNASGGVQRVNKALDEMLPESKARSASRLDDLFSREDAGEIRYLMNRARRTGVASQQLDVRTAGRTLHLNVTVAAVERGRNSGFVVVIEDASDLLRAQRTAAWSEVARRVAHEIKNPLTPITLSAERIMRQANRASLSPAVRDLMIECANTILDETTSVKRLVDEFSQFSRLPSAQTVLCSLNDVVATGMAVFEGRLEGIEVHVDLAPQLPPVMVDPEQFKRVIVNLVDNAAEAMQDSPLKILNVTVRPGFAETVEIEVADSGCGITPDEKEKLFLPYFSTKGRGTGLGLAIVSHILTEHGASIRVEDNKPCGARFTIEVPVAAADEAKPPVNPVTLNA